MGKRYKPVTIVAIACALVRKRGWVNKPKDDSIPAGEGLWTSDQVRLIVTRKMPSPEWLNQSDVDKACKILEDLRTRTNLTGNSERGDKQLQERLRVWDSSGVPLEDIGACAVIAIYGKHGLNTRYPRKERWERLQSSVPRGNIGEWLRFDPPLRGVISHVISLPHRRRLIKVEGSDGNGYQWTEKGSREVPLPYVAEGETLYIERGKVKCWSEYEGVTWTEFRENACVLSSTCYDAPRGPAIKHEVTN